MKFVVMFLCMLATSAQAKELFNERGFKVETAGWVDQEVFADWLGIKVGLTIPINGYVVLETKGSFAFHLPCKGWVLDTGIIVANGCTPNPQTGRDTRQYRQLAVTEDMGCEQQGGRVLMVIRIPKMFPTTSCRPDSVRWVNGAYYVDED